MRLSIVGCWYVGLVTRACLAEAGHQVVRTDNDQARIAALQAGRTNSRDGKLSFTGNAGEAVREYRGSSAWPRGPEWTLAR
jgi:UDPglucose 6-dehydrogenase